MDAGQHPKRILFVDDEPHLLAGLKRSLRGERRAWEMHFAESGEEALRLLDKASFDAVVSDMRMPGMGGAALLREIAHRQPPTVRIVLSGQFDERMSLSLVGVAHQFLTKPCKADTLKAVLMRAFALRALLSGECLKGVVETLDSLPSIPTVYTELTQRIRKENATLREMGQLIAADPPMTAKLLQVVNSAFFGIGRRITNPEDAAALLGIETLKGLVLTAGIFQQFEGGPLASGSVSLQSLWRHSVAVGRLARDIAVAEDCDRATVDDSLAAGLLHDIGLLLLAFRMPSTWAKVEKLVFEDGMFRWDAEKRVAGATHNAVGAYLLGLWGLPESVVEAVGFTHSPSESCSRVFGALAAVHVADALVHGDRRIDSDYIEGLGVEPRLEHWRDLAAALPTDPDE
jgi:HD-like signal output (HDOD) protein